MYVLSYGTGKGVGGGEIDEKRESCGKGCRKGEIFNRISHVLSGLSASLSETPATSLLFKWPETEIDSHN